MASHDLNQLFKSTGESEYDSAQLNTQTAATLAAASNAISGSTHSLAVLAKPDQSPHHHRDDQGHDNGTDIYMAVAGPSGNSERYARLPGRTGWVRSGATEMGLDCLRRHLLDLPVDEKIDFEVR